MPLFDASSLQAALRKLRGDAVPILEGQTILDLTIYELGNIVWKENRASGGTPEQASEKAKNIAKLLSIMEIRRVEPGEMPAIAGNAAAYGLTFYDSAYLTTANEAAITLITEDEDLLRAAQKAGAKTTTMDQHLKNSL